MATAKSRDPLLQPIGVHARPLPGRDGVPQSRLSVNAKFDDKVGKLTTSSSDCVIWTADGDSHPTKLIQFADIESVERVEHPDLANFLIILSFSLRGQERKVEFQCTYIMATDLEAQIMCATLEIMLRAHQQGVPDPGLPNDQLLRMRRTWIIKHQGALVLLEHNLESGVITDGEMLQLSQLRAVRTSWPEIENLQWTLYPQPYHCCDDRCRKCNQMWKSPKEQAMGEEWAYVGVLGNGEATQAIDQLVDGMQKMREDLKSLLCTHGDAIKLKWDRATKDERWNLLDGQQAMPMNRWAAIERRCDPTTCTLLSRNLDYYLPYLTGEALVHDPSVLYTMIHQRTFHHPSEFLAGDLFETAKSTDAGTLGEKFNDQCVDTSESNYGKVVPWTADAAHAGGIISMPQALSAFQAQFNMLLILGFLVQELIPGGSDNWMKAAANDFPSESDNEINASNHYSNAIEDEDSNELPEPQMSRLMAFPFELQESLDPNVFLETATEKLAEVEEALRVMQSEPEHVQAVVKGLRRLSHYKRIPDRELWPSIAQDLWMPLFRRAQAWNLVKARAETLVKVFQANPCDLSTAQTLPNDLAAACTAMHHTLDVQAFALIIRQIRECLPQTDFLQQYYPDIKGSIMDSKYAWTVEEFHQHPLVWACSRLEQLGNNIQRHKYHEATTAVNLLSHHFAQNGSEGSERLVDIISDMSTVLWLISILDVTRPARPQYAGLDHVHLEYNIIRRVIELPDAEHMVNNAFQYLLHGECKGIAWVKDFNLKRLGLAGTLLQNFCEKAPWPTSGIDNIKSLVASTLARSSLLQFWKTMREDIRANIKAENPRKEVDDKIWEIQMASFFLSDEIRREFQQEMDNLVDKRQKVTAALQLQQVAERARIKQFGNEYNQEWKRKSETQYGGVSKTRTKGKKGEKKAQEENLKPKPLDNNSKIFLSFLTEFAGMFDQELPPSPTNDPPPSPDRFTISIKNYAVVCWMWPGHPDNKKMAQGKKTWTNFRGMMAEVGFESRCVGGSHFQFQGQTPDGVKHTVSFHDPTHGQPAKAIADHILRRLGRRLNRQFGWTFDSFRCGNK